MNTPHLSRRTVLARTAVITGAAVAASFPGSQWLSSPAYAAGTDPTPKMVREAVRRAEARNRRVMTGKPSRNGWEMERVADDGGNIYTCPVPGTPLTDVQVRMGDVEVVLVHVIRRFHYEIDELRKGDVVGWRSPGSVRKGMPESNQASGTAVQIRPGSYPSGTNGGFFSSQRIVLRDILAELDGIVRWGGDDTKPDEALFYIQVPPGDKRLAVTAAKLRGWHDRPGAGAGSPVDVFNSKRRIAAEKLEQRQQAA
ncbi:hypothetical protein C9F11_21265 [Streptomyces sp. YIM 121038]|uniref:hypothetical protein n=1 Tax=Streptomyces sp. YIM 121038 TaxID=2136401 RepID=UPI0011107002|nr:hypothetical protein [Streptomyces sp. YIM 121038]QCX77885.1 hypothetical protein C9F11_21265 [Streptomyces sp. YIM 121038]